MASSLRIAVALGLLCLTTVLWLSWREEPKEAHSPLGNPQPPSSGMSAVGFKQNADTEELEHSAGVVSGERVGLTDVSPKPPILAVLHANGAAIEDSGVLWCECLFPKRGAELPLSVFNGAVLAQAVPSDSAGPTGLDGLMGIRPVRFEGEDGRFALPIEKWPGAYVFFNIDKLNGQVGSGVNGGDRDPVRGAPPTPIEVVFVDSWEIVVLGDQGKDPERVVLAIEEGGMTGWYAAQPGPEAREVGVYAGGSPIALPATGPRAVYWLSSPGFAPYPFHWASRWEHPRTVTLQRLASVDFSASGWATEALLELRLAVQADQAWRPISAEPLLVGAPMSKQLAPGRYAALLWQQNVLLGERQFSVEPGERLSHHWQRGAEASVLRVQLQCGSEAEAMELAADGGVIVERLPAPGLSGSAGWRPLRSSVSGTEVLMQWQDLPYGQYVLLYGRANRHVFELKQPEEELYLRLLPEFAGQVYFLTADEAGIARPELDSVYFSSWQRDTDIPDEFWLKGTALGGPLSQPVTVSAPGNRLMLHYQIHGCLHHAIIDWGQEPIVEVVVPTTWALDLRSYGQDLPMAWAQGIKVYLANGVLVPWESRATDMSRTTWDAGDLDAIYLPRSPDGRHWGRLYQFPGVSGQITPSPDGTLQFEPFD